MRQVICSLHAENVVPVESLNTYPDTIQIISQLPQLKLYWALTFCRVLAEDVQNGANLGPQYYHLDALLKTNTTDATMLMTHSFAPSTALSREVRVETVDCFSAWVNYGHSHWATDPVALQLLQNITPMALEHLLNYDEDVRDPTVELFVSILEYRSKFLQKEQLDTISELVRKTIGPQCLVQIQQDAKEPAVVAFGKLITAYGKLVVKDLATRRDQTSSQEIMSEI